MEKVALLVVYNHRYDKNIPIIDKIYGDRFSYIFHIVPFYDGTKQNVIPVYESSYYFQGYIAQAYTHLKKCGFTHFFIIADDLILNPAVNEHNLWNVIGISKEDNLFPNLSFLQEIGYWRQTPRAVKYDPNLRGVEIGNIIPSKDKAIEIFKNRGIPTSKLRLKNLICFSSIKGFLRSLYHFPFQLNFSYPLVGGYSDTFMLTSKVMETFCNYCGAFAATNLFAEIAIPTALMLTTDKVRYIYKCNLTKGDMWSSKEKESFYNHYSYNLKDLLDNFPNDKLYVHPIKLSKWDVSKL